MARKKSCQVVVDDLGTECGITSIGKVDARGLGIEAHVDVCKKHKAVLNTTAAELRLAGRR